MILFKYLGWLSPILALATIILSSLIVVNSTIYFDGGPTPVFLLEKGNLQDSNLWMTAFYAHVISACICLLVGLPLMFPAALRFRKLHIYLGYVYFSCVLWVAAPTGLLIAPFAKGGASGATGFLLTGVLWWWVTWMGLRAVVPRTATMEKEWQPTNPSRDIAAHIRWMVRSYSIALSAVAFRLIQIALFNLGVSDQLNYIASIWLSLFSSFVISELCVNFALKTRPKQAYTFAKSIVVTNST